eukprot:augustus_masked-scaffold_5-processed-gene-10.48-mRNA-1 protein AED:0.39 eAED:0.39 QI:0/-1/0/1/-1/1/1/0/462
MSTENVKSDRAENLLQELTILKVRLQKQLNLDNQLIENQRIYESIDLRKGNKRELLTTERSSELLFPYLSIDKSSVTEVHLSTKSFDEDSAQIFANYLSDLPHLFVADLSDIIAGREESIALKVLDILCASCLSEQTKKLDLSENALGEKGIRLLEGSLRKISAREIFFRNNGLSALSMELLCSYLDSKSIFTLEFHNNMSGCGGAVALSKFLEEAAVHSKLRSLRMSSCRVKAQGGSALIKSLFSLKQSLVTLDISDSMFGVDGANLLAKVLKELTLLEECNIKDTGLEVEGVGKVLEVIADENYLKLLRVLDLSALEIGASEETMKLLGDVLLNRKVLEEIGLQENELSEELDTLIEALNGKDALLSLKRVYLNTNELKVKQTLKLLKSMIARFPCLEQIELDDNMFSETGVLKMKEYLISVCKFSTLGSLEENYATDEEEDSDEVDYLAAQLSSSLKIN